MTYRIRLHQENNFIYLYFDTLLEVQKAASLLYSACEQALSKQEIEIFMEEHGWRAIY